jgi:hypothetical protein
MYIKRAIGYSAAYWRYEIMMLTPLCPNRVRKIAGSFAFIEHRFLHQGFWADLDHHQLLLYVFLAMVADRFGLSYYSYDKIRTLLRLTLDEYIEARNALIEKDLLAFDGRLFQVLSLPAEPVRKAPVLLKTDQQMQRDDPATVRRLIQKALDR